MSVLASQLESVASLQTMRVTGSIVALRGLTLTVRDLPMPVGSLVSVRGPDGNVRTPACARWTL